MDDAGSSVPNHFLRTTHRALATHIQMLPTRCPICLIAQQPLFLTALRPFARVAGKRAAAAICESNDGASIL
jgi:hypothetical protein